MSVINGTNLFVLVNGTAIAHSRSHSLNLSEEPRDTTSKDSGGWRTLLEGLRQWSVSGDALVDYDATPGHTYEDLYDIIVARAAIALRFTTDVTSDVEWYGQARLVSIEKSAEYEQNGEMSFTFEGTGPLSKRTII